MKIQTLDIKHAASHKATSIALDRPVAIFFGANSSGKTPTARAVELVLRGAIAAYEGSRAHPLRRFIRRGEDTAEVTGTIARSPKETPVTLTRRLTAKGVTTHVNDKDTGNVAFDFFLPPGVGQPDAVLKVLTQTDNFFALPDAEQKALLSSLIEQSVSAEDVKDLPLGRLGPMPMRTLADIDMGYEIAYQRRKDTKARLTGLQVAPDPGTTDLPDVDGVARKLTGLKEDEKAILSGLGSSGGARKALEQEVTRATTRVASLDTQLAALGDATAEAARLTDVTAQIGLAATTQARAAQASAELSQRRDDLKKLTGTRHNLAALKKVCVISADIVCPLKPEDRKKADDTWAKRIDELTKEIGTRERELPKVPDTEGLDRERTRLSTTAERRRTLTEQHTEAVANVTRLTTQLEAAPAAPDEQEPPALAALRARIANGETNLSGARELARRITDYAAYREKAGALEVEIADLETLCTALGPKGLRERLIAARLGALQAEVNRVLGAFGLSVEYVAEPWEIRVNGSGGPDMGKAEAFRAGVAHQVALAHVTGVRFFQVDGMDLLDAGNRAAFFGVLDYAVTLDLVDQALCFATFTRPPGPSQVPWATHFLIERSGDATVITPIAEGAR